MSNETAARELAGSFRRDHGLDLAPIKDMFELLHLTVGVDVLSVKADEAEHGLSMTDTASGRVVIAVATTVHPMRQRSSVAHELGHVLAGDLERDLDGQPGERSPSEIQADAFARHLLLPLDAVRVRLEGRFPIELADVSDLVQEFEVSPTVAAIQMREAGHIHAETCSDWMGMSTRVLAATYGWLSQYQALVKASSQPHAPQALMARAAAAYQGGMLGIGELAFWYGQPATELMEELTPVTPPEPFEDDMGVGVPLFPSSKPPV
ncbi:MAG: ImmA/IrrE family metallo-endopeptidase [Candidatus Nanopelagicales bacterium]